MREIKFRAWNKTKNRMFAVSGLSYNPLQVCVGQTIGRGKAEIPLQCFPIEECELLQYICMKDRNDKEVYEGDIVRLDKTEVGWIVYDNTSASFIVQSFAFWSFLHLTDRIEVVGNIYENHELLTN